MIVKTSRAMAAVDSARPGKSRPAASAFFDAGTLTATSAAAAAATGPMAKKMLAQLKCSSSQPPTIGPSAMAIPALAPHRPMARARSARPVKTLVISESVAGKIMAAPSPITARAAMSWSGLVVKPPITLAVPKTASPASSIPLRPTRSDRAPDVSSKAAKTRLYASTTHCNWLVVAPSSRTRVGSATLTSVVSRLMTKASISRAMRIIGLERNIVEILKYYDEKVNLLVSRVNRPWVSWLHAHLRAVLFGGQGARRCRRPVDPADYQGASPPGSVPVHGPEERAAWHRHE